MELQNYNKTSKCQLCYVQSHQVKTIFKSLYIHLKSFLKRGQKDSLSQQNKNYHFDRLLRIILPEYLQIDSHGCRHQILIQYFLTKLDISRNIFQTLCEKIADKIGRRNYQLETLVNQIKNTELYLQKQFEKGAIQVKNTESVQIKRSQKKKCSIIPVQTIQQEQEQPTPQNDSKTIVIRKQTEQDQKQFISDKTMHSKSELIQNIQQNVSKKEIKNWNQISPQINYSNNNQFGYIPTFPFSGYSFDSNFNPFWSYK